ncbi:MAG: DUF2298 domain-containing protein, partial [Anaerolineales bacterium]
PSSNSISSSAPQSGPPSRVAAPRSGPPSPYLAGVAAALLIVVLGNLAQVRTFLVGFQKAADREALAASPLGDSDLSATLNGVSRVLSGEAKLPVGLGNWYWDATRVVAHTLEQRQGRSGNEITEFPFFTFLYADLHAHMVDLPFMVLALAWAASYLLDARKRLPIVESIALWFIGGLALGVARPTNTWDFPTFLALGLVAIVAAHWLRDPSMTRANLFAVGWRLAALGGLAFALYYPFGEWFAPAYSQLKRNLDSFAPISAYLYIYGLFLFVLVTFLVWETRRFLAETPATVVTRAGEWLPLLALALVGVGVGVIALWYLKVAIGVIALPLMAWAGLLLLRSRETMPVEKRIVLFLIGTGLAITLFVELFGIGGDRMNTIFKFYIQVWALLSVAGGAALAWAWAALREWKPSWRMGWTTALSLFVAAAALYTVTATNAKIRDRFPSFTAGGGCQPIAGMPMPPGYGEGLSLAPENQPHSLDGLDYLKWSAYCDHDHFLPLAYDHDAIEWMQQNVPGSPVIVEAQSFDLYRMSSRYAWNTGLPDVVGWDWHTRQHNAAIPTEFVTQRGREIIAFYCGGAALTPDQLAQYPACQDALLYEGLGPDWSLNFIRKYDVRYVVVGTMERAYYPPDGLAMFDGMVASGQMVVAYQNRGVTIYEVRAAAAGQ